MLVFILFLTLDLISLSIQPTRLFLLLSRELSIFSVLLKAPPCRSLCRRGFGLAFTLGLALLLCPLRNARTRGSFFLLSRCCLRNDETSLSFSLSLSLSLSRLMISLSSLSSVSLFYLSVCCFQHKSLSSLFSRSVCIFPLSFFPFFS